MTLLLVSPSIRRGGVPYTYTPDLYQQLATGGGFFVAGFLMGLLVYYRGKRTVENAKTKAFEQLKAGTAPPKWLEDGEETLRFGMCNRGRFLSTGGFVTLTTRRLRFVPLKLRGSGLDAADEWRVDGIVSTERARVFGLLPSALDLTTRDGTTVRLVFSYWSRDEWLGALDEARAKAQYGEAPALAEGDAADEGERSSD